MITPLSKGEHHLLYIAPDDKPNGLWKCEHCSRVIHGSAMLRIKNDWRCFCNGTVYPVMKEGTVVIDPAGVHKFGMWYESKPGNASHKLANVERVMFHGLPSWLCVPLDTGMLSATEALSLKEAVDLFLKKRFCVKPIVVYK